MLAAFSIVRKEFPAARLKIFGSRRQEIISILQELELTDFVEIHEEVSQEVLAFHTRQSIASILYSDCETFGCVIIEANACGIPVIVSDIPVFHETVEDNVNGLFVPPRQPGKLAEKNDRNDPQKYVIRSCINCSACEIEIQLCNCWKANKPMVQERIGEILTALQFIYQRHIFFHRIFL